MFKRFLLVPLCLFTSALAFADHHEETEAASGPEGASDLRAEYQFCTLNKGKTLKDVDKYSQKYGTFAAENGVKYNQTLLTPVHAGASMGDYLLFSVDRRGTKMAQWSYVVCGNDRL